MSRTPEHVDRATPEACEHTDEILAELGYSADELDAMRLDGVIT